MTHASRPGAVEANVVRFTRTARGSTAAPYWLQRLRSDHPEWCLDPIVTVASHADLPGWE
ncbi:MAG: hypothetical protein ACLGIO_12075 [Acidimicrobiia bacterium]